MKLVAEHRAASWERHRPSSSAPVGKGVVVVGSNRTWEWGEIGVESRTYEYTEYSPSRLNQRQVRVTMTRNPVTREWASVTESDPYGGWEYIPSEAYLNAYRKAA